uniref:Uncharacterized protein n=1 Tax=Anguilla anguilla TaxID=7936 RepID=A0A0E9XDG2_ANGAN
MNPTPLRVLPPKCWMRNPMVKFWITMKRVSPQAPMGKLRLMQ